MVNIRNRQERDLRDGCRYIYGKRSWPIRLEYTSHVVNEKVPMDVVMIVVQCSYTSRGILSCVFVARQQRGLIISHAL